MTTTSTVDITLVDSSNYETVYKINNPMDELTLTEIRNAYSAIIAAGLLYSRYGNPITSVARAVITLTTKETIS